MAFTKIDSTGQTDLSTKLHDWLTSSPPDGPGWEELKSWGSGRGGWYKANGAGVGRNLFVYLYHTSNSNTGGYFIQLGCATSYDDSIANDQQANFPPFNSYVCTWDKPMTSWVYANDRRLIIVNKVNTSYTSGYVGMFLPFALPEEYPFPLYSSGNAGYQIRFDTANSGNRMITDPGQDSSGYFMKDTSTWRLTYNAEWGSEDRDMGTSMPPSYLWPMRSGQAYNGYREDDWNHSLFSQHRPLGNGMSPAWNCLIIDTILATCVGTLDGVYAIPGSEVVSEQLLEYNGSNIRVFQNVYRTGPNNYFAVEER